MLNSHRYMALKVSVGPQDLLASRPEAGAAFPCPSPRKRQQQTGKAKCGHLGPWVPKGGT